MSASHEQFSPVRLNANDRLVREASKLIASRSVSLDAGATAEEAIAELSVQLASDQRIDLALARSACDLAWSIAVAEPVARDGKKDKQFLRQRLQEIRDKVQEALSKPSESVVWEPKLRDPKDKSKGIDWMPIKRITRSNHANATLLRIMLDVERVVSAIEKLPETVNIGDIYEMIFGAMGASKSKRVKSLVKSGSSVAHAIAEAAVSEVEDE